MLWLIWMAYLVTHDVGLIGDIVEQKPQELGRVLLLVIPKLDCLAFTKVAGVVL